MPVYKYFLRLRDVVGAAIALCLPSCCPGFVSQAHHVCLLHLHATTQVLYYICNCVENRTIINKRGRVWYIFKKKSQMHWIATELFCIRRWSLVLANVVCWILIVNFNINSGKLCKLLRNWNNYKEKVVWNWPKVELAAKVNIVTKLKKVFGRSEIQTFACSSIFLHFRKLKFDA